MTRLSTVDVPATEANRLAAAMQNGAPSPYRNFHDFVRFSLEQAAPLLGWLLPQLMHFVSTESTGSLLIRKLPIDSHLPTTPTSPEAMLEAKRSFLSEGLLLAIASVLGTPFCYAEEEQGLIVRNIVARDFESTVGGGTFGAHKLDFHTEISWCAVRPDFLLLLCLRHEDSADTLIAPARAALELLEEVELATLRKPWFHIGVSELFSHAFSADHLWTDGVPIVSGPDQSPQIRVNYNFIRAFRPGASKAVQALEDALSQVSFSVSLKPGDMLLLDNRKLAHGRAPKAHSCVRSGRWLQQVYVTRDGWRLRDSLLEDGFSVRGSELLADINEG